MHLPYHLLATVQSLFRKGGAWRDWPAPASEATEGTTGKSSSSSSWRGGDDGVDFVYFTEADQVTTFRDRRTARAISSSLLFDPPSPDDDKLQGHDAHAALAPFPRSHHDPKEDGSTSALPNAAEHVSLEAIEFTHADNLHAVAAAKSQLAEAVQEARASSSTSSARLKKRAGGLAKVLKDAERQARESETMLKVVVQDQGHTGRPSAANAAVTPSGGSGAAASKKSQRWRKRLYFIAPQRMAMRFGPEQFRILEASARYTNGAMTLSEAFGLIDAQQSPAVFSGETVSHSFSFAMTNKCSECPPLQCPKDATRRFSVVENRERKRREKIEARKKARYVALFRH